QGELKWQQAQQLTKKLCLTSNGSRLEPHSSKKRKSSRSCATNSANSAANSRGKKSKRTTFLKGQTAKNISPISSRAAASSWSITSCSGQIGWKAARAAPF